ncbi:hypothetical protein EU524_01190 [Candidatus Thorarchaeota archaeon]|nr:MAG: hypothetical protein EU524_01190 [Candidatus Thorarchaeota archaeon]
MTGQVSDEFRVEGNIYALVGVNGEGLYVPADFGMETFSSCTACWRGYVMQYDVKDDELLLVGMDLNTKNPVSINGVEPVEATESFMKYRYVDIGLKTNFTGTILLGADFMSERYVHMGFQSAESYRKVIELVVENGDVLEIRDLSEEMEERRKSGMEEKPREPSSLGDGVLSTWIKDRFSLDYDSE